MSEEIKKVKKINDVVWEIPISYKSGMNVPGRIIATEKLLNDIDSGVFDQVTNVACLPGIVGYSFAMPDCHWGYGSSIGGVSAFDPEIGGVISPGIVGFDINCLHPDSKISFSDGYWIRFKDINDSFIKHKIKSMDLNKNKLKITNTLLFMAREEKKEIYLITTESNKRIKATGDHPMITSNGTILTSSLKEEDYIYTHPFNGVEYKDPKDKILISQKDIENVLDELNITNKGNARTQIINKLKKLKLLNLKTNSKQVSILIKLMGFIFGDGSISFVNGKNGIVSFYANKEDLISIQKDILSLGLSCPNIFSRDRNHKIKTYYDTIKFEYNEKSIVKGSTAFAVLLVALGVPYGRKTSKKYRIPEWIMNAELWQKRLFLASFFGAELSTPSTINKYNFYCPQINMNKKIDIKNSAIDYLNDMRDLLSEFGVKSNYPVEVNGNQYDGVYGKTCGFRVLISDNPKNLVNLYRKIGFEYNLKKQKLSCLAINYILIKQSMKKQRIFIRKKAIKMYNNGTSASEIKSLLISKYVGKRFIEHAIWTNGRENSRISFNFLSFDDYVKEYAIGESGIVKDKVKSIKKIPYNGLVYDFTINDSDHNFIANSIITHNCGMRLITTNLTWSDVKPKSKELVETLFKNVPAGVGVKGFVKINKPQFKEMTELGSKWCIDNGYGWEEDLERTESQGVIDWADSSKVTQKALDRGMNQLGTLGSGNHYLEVQHVKSENIYDEDLLNKFGLFPDQVVIMVHCGSRGFGHQIATDYMKIFEPAMNKYNINIKDRELVCAPFNSKEGQDYYGAMACAANMAFANRQVILHRIRESFEQVFKQKSEDLNMHLVYDVAHNIARYSEFKVDGHKKKLVVHRKGATLALGPGNKELAPMFQKTGQPVIIGGSMETGSFLLVGTKKAEEETFGSTCHGSGRTMSRTKAKGMIRGDDLQKDMEKRGIIVKSASMSGLAEEWGNAYKDINEVVKSVTLAGISKPVVGLVPKLNVKG